MQTNGLFNYPELRMGGTIRALRTTNTHLKQKHSLLDNKYKQINNSTFRKRFLKDNYS